MLLLFRTHFISRVFFAQCSCQNFCIDARLSLSLRTNKQRSSIPVEDAELNDGSVERPHLMSAQLKNILVNTDESHVYRPTELESAQTGADGLSTDAEI